MPRHWIKDACESARTGHCFCNDCMDDRQRRFFLLCQEFYKLFCDLWNAGFCDRSADVVAYDDSPSDYGCGIGCSPNSFSFIRAGDHCGKR